MTLPAVGTLASACSRQWIRTLRAAGGAAGGKPVLLLGLPINAQLLHDVAAGRARGARLLDAGEVLLHELAVGVAALACTTVRGPFVSTTSMTFNKRKRKSSVAT